MINGNDCVFALKLDGTNYLPVYCATSFSFNLVSNDIEVTVNSDGRFRDYAQNTFSYTLSLDGMAAIDSSNSSFDVLLAQMEFFTIPYRLIYEEDAGVHTIEGECIVVSSSLTAAADQGLGMSHTFQGKGNFNAFVDGEPNDGGEIPDDGGDGGGGPGEGGEGDECLVVINDDILDIIIAPNPPLTYDYRVQLNDIVGTWAYIAWRLDGGIWHYETSQEFMLPHLENGSYTLELAAVCANGIFSESVNKTLDVFNETPAVCDGTIDSWSYDYIENEDGTFTVTYTVNSSSPTETLNNIQYKLDSGPDAGIWITRPVVDGVTVFSVDLPDLTFSIDLRSVCSNGGFGYSVEDGGEIPEPSSCSTSIAILGYYLTYSFDTYSASAVINYTLSDPIEDILEIQWLSTVTNAWVKVADAAEPIIVIPVVPGTLTNQQFRVVCSSSYNGPISSILISVPIKQAQLDSRIINYTDTNAHYDVIINGTTNISQGQVAANNITEFNYYGILNVPVTVRLTLDTPIDADACVLITNNTTYTGVVDGGDPNSIDFSVTVTYGIVIAFWAIEVIPECLTVVDFEGYAIRYDEGASNWIVTPIYTVTDNIDPTAVIEYWNGSTWVELGDADSFTPLEFTVADDTTTAVKLRAKCSEGSFGPESDPIDVIAPEFSSWTPTHSVINYSYESQTVIILQNGVEIFNETMSPRSTLPITLSYWDAGEEIAITTSPGYPRIPSDTPDDTITWYTQIRNGDTYVGSYSHDSGDTHTVLVNGAGVDLADGVVFAIQATDTPITLYVVESVDYTFDPDTGAFEGFPTLNTGTTYYQYSIDDGATWTTQHVSVPISETLTTGDEVWVRAVDSFTPTVFGDTTIVTVEACPLVISDITAFFLGYNASGTPDWTVTFLYDISTFTGLENIQYYDGTTWYALDITAFVNDRAIVLNNYYGANDQTIVQEFRTVCTDGRIGESVNISLAFPDFSSWTPTNNSAVLNYGSTTETYEIFVDGVSVASGTTSPLETSEVFNFTTEPSGLSTVKVTLGTSVPDPTHFVLSTAYGAVHGTYGAIIDPGDSQSVLFENVDLRDPFTSNARGMIITFWA